MKAQAHKRPCDAGGRGCKYRPRNPKDGQQPPEDPREEQTPSHLWREPSLLTPWLWTSGLGHCESTHSCGFSASSLWSFVTAALGNSYRGIYRDPGLHRPTDGRRHLIQVPDFTKGKKDTTKNILSGKAQKRFFHIIQCREWISLFLIPLWV